MFYLIGEYNKVTLSKAEELLNLSQDQITNKPRLDLMTNVRGKQAYLYTCSSDGDHAFDADGHRWFNGGSTKNSSVLKTYFYAAIAPNPESDRANKQAKYTTDFKKHVFCLVGSNFAKGTTVLIWYDGDHSKSQLFAHGNSKTGRPYLPTIRSKRQTLKEKCFLHESLELTYANLSTDKSLQNGNYASLT